MPYLPGFPKQSSLEAPSCLPRAATFLSPQQREILPFRSLQPECVLIFAWIIKEHHGPLQAALWLGKAERSPGDFFLSHVSVASILAMEGGSLAFLNTVLSVGMWRRFWLKTPLWGELLLCLCPLLWAKSQSLVMCNRFEDGSSLPEDPGIPSCVSL